MKKSSIFLYGLVVAILVVVICTALIQLIWNKVLIKKFPQSNIQKLSFFDALAIGVLSAILFSSSVIIMPVKMCTEGTSVQL